MKYLIILLVFLAVESQAQEVILIMSPRRHTAVSEGTIHYVHVGATTHYTTIAQINALTLSAGDSVLFPVDTTFRGALNIGQSGTSGSRIVIGSYGTGDAPILLGSESLSGWTARGSAYSAKPTTAVKELFANGNRMVIARSPNFNTVWARTSNVSGSTQTDYSLARASGYFIGGKIRARTSEYTMCPRTISGDDGATLTFDATNFALENGKGFFVDGVGVPDTVNEWVMNATADSVLFMGITGTTPSSLTVEGVTQQHNVRILGNYVTVENLDLRYTDSSNVMISGNRTGVKINNCSLTGSREGIMARGDNISCSITNNTIRDMHMDGMQIAGRLNLIQGNTIECVGLWRGFNYGLAGEVNGISVGGTCDTIRANIIDSCGYNGIMADADSSVYEQNYLTKVCLNMDDGGAIYVGASTYSVWRDNIIDYVGSDSTGWNSGNAPYNFALYMDLQTEGLRVENNTVAHSSGSGIFSQYYNTKDTVRYNTFYDCGQNTFYAARYITYADGPPTNMVFRGNILNAAESVLGGGQGIGLCYRVNDAVDPGFGSMDSNTYVVPTTGAHYLVETGFGTTWTEYATLGDWQGASAYDDNSSQVSYAVDDDTLIYNATNETVVVNLPAVYKDLDGNTGLTSVSLAPWASKILLVDDTHYYVATTGDDGNSGHYGAPWQTVDKVNGSTFAAGDSIFFNKGDHWHESLVPPSSGTAIKPIVFASYGTGAKPFLDSCGTQGAVNVYNKDYVVVDGFKLSGGRFNGSGYGVQIESADYVTLKNCYIRGLVSKDSSNNYGVHLYDAANCTVSNDSISLFGYGIRAESSTSTGYAGVIENNVLTEINRGPTSDWDAINVNPGGAITAANFSGMIIRNNDVSGFCEDGVDCYYADSVLVYGNYIHDNSNTKASSNSTGFKTLRNGSIFRKNRIVNLTASDNNFGVHIGGDFVHIVSDTFYNCSDYGILIGVTDKDVTGVTVDSCMVRDSPVAFRGQVTVDTTIVQRNFFHGTTHDMEVDGESSVITGGLNILKGGVIPTLSSGGMYNGTDKDTLGSDITFLFSDNFMNGVYTGWTQSGQWSSSSGNGLCTPLVGAELMTNGDMSSATGWTVNAGWAISGGVATGTTTSESINQEVLTAGAWYLGHFDLKTRTAGYVNLNLGADSEAPWYVTPADNYYASIVADNAYAMTGGSGFSGTLDNVSCKRITLASTLATVDVGATSMTVSANVTISGATRIGVVASYADTSNFVYALLYNEYDNGISVALYKRVGGTTTAVIAPGNIDYVANAPLKIVRSGNNYSLYYNGTQCGTTQSITDGGITSNTKAGLLSTYAGATVQSAFITSP
jgi:hypothetical protein